MNVDDLRRAFLDYFERQGHRRIPSASLVPHGDPTLLFTSAGMVQFKPYFMGLEEPPARRLTSIQRCFRTTDVEETGDETHLTMFEMLGNFSIGDYFKSEAIDWAWEFLTGVLGIPADRLWATVYTDDDEAADLWAGHGVPRERILRYTSEQGNWWGPPGETGPMGPCSEMHYDWGATPGCEFCAGATCHPDVGCGRFLEIWNLVFMTYFQEEDGSRSDLPAANIDTGAGLERLASVLQGVRSVYETDELRHVLAVAEEVSGCAYDPEGAPDVAFALRAMTEHARAFAFLVNDGVLPSNDGRGYVLRRLLRRAVYFGHQIGLREAFLERIVDAAIDRSLAANAELANQRDFIKRVARVEEARFQATLERGLQLLDDVIERERDSKRIPGRDMFVLYDTHGLPSELTLEVAHGYGYEVDRDGFEAEMAAQRERSKGEAAFAGGGDDDTALRYAALGLETSFVGYEAMDVRSVILHLARDGRPVDRLEQGDRGELVLHTTTFYPEGGGQVGDHGEIITAGGRARVTDTQRYAETIVHLVEVIEGAVAVREAAEAQVDMERRLDTARNHTATHLLHSALRYVLGSHVRQAGSYVGPDRLRFDYTHPEAPSEEEQQGIQRMVNARVRADIESATMVMSYEEAMSRGAIAFFEDRYTDQVRMVEYCDQRGLLPEHEHTPECYSRELCGGTHLHSTGEVGMLVIASDSSIGAGLRRIEAFTGATAERYIEDRLDTINLLARRFRSQPAQILERVESLEQELETLRRRAEEAERKAAASAADDLVDRAETVGDARLLAGRVEVDSADALRPMVDRLRGRLGSAVVILAAEVKGRPSFIAAVTDDLVDRGVRADEIVRTAAGVAGGGGGGRPQLAQAGGQDASKIEEALDAARDAARERLGTA